MLEPAEPAQVVAELIDDLARRYAVDDQARASDGGEHGVGGVGARRDPADTEDPRTGDRAVESVDDTRAARSELARRGRHAVRPRLLEHQEVGQLAPAARDAA
jgi:hypothetical protein